MNPGNGAYGHRAVLADYCGVAERPIWGFLQHGWSYGNGIAHVEKLSPRFPKFVWSAADMAAMRSHGVDKVAAVGAPFLYLDEPVASPGEGTLVYPFHSFERGEAVGSHADYLAEISERERGPLTICLYWREYDDARIRTIYEASGSRVITHGHRDTTPDFLIRQHREISRHRRVVANRIGTAIVYAGSLGREIELYGRVFGYRSADEGDVFAGTQRRRWPDLHDGGIGGAVARDWSRLELGAEFVRRPDELVALFGWSGAKRILGGVVNMAISARRPFVRRMRQIRPID